ncbi:MAG TPA: AraC family transcriptional regulator, partial [Fimbriimonadaceae bacterium]|nr:AraC family transcriptional regulator [Fimbriimonadaceae bacterium]
MAGDFFPGRLETREAGGFRICLASYPTELAMPLHGHRDPYFSFVLTGGYEERVGRASRQVSPSMLVFHPPDEEHAVRFAPVRTQILRVEVPTSLKYRFDALQMSLRDAAGPVNGPAVAIARRMAGEFVSRDLASNLVLEALCLELIACVARKPTEGGPLTRRVDDFVRSHLFETIRIDQMAAELEVSPSSLARAFRQANGITIGEYVRTLRLEWAAQQLTTSSRNIGDIAVEAGFWDQAHFSRAF